MKAIVYKLAKKFSPILAIFAIVTALFTLWGIGYSIDTFGSDIIRDDAPVLIKHFAFAFIGLFLGFLTICLGAILRIVAFLPLKEIIDNFLDDKIEKLPEPKLAKEIPPMAIPPRIYEEIDKTLTRRK